eukprot:TCONS_00055301-protein
MNTNTRRNLTALANSANELSRSLAPPPVDSQTSIATSTRPSIPSTSSARSGSASAAREVQSLFPTLVNTAERANKAKGKKKKISKKEKIITTHKDVVLLPHGCEAVPTHQARINLENQAMVVHRYPVERQWDEQQMKVAILALFKDKNLTSFQYVKACYSRIIVPNLAMGEVYDARCVLDLSGQGALYVRALEKNPLLSMNEEETSQSEEEDVTKAEDVQNTPAIVVPTPPPSFDDDSDFFDDTM